jgi:hypothetical protein
MTLKERIVAYSVVFIFATAIVCHGPFIHSRPVVPVFVPVSPTSTPKQSPRFAGDLQKFLKKMGHYEGLGSYQTVNSHGYLGLYQFSPRTLRVMGFHVTKDEFLNNPSLQDSVMIALMREHARELRPVIQEFAGTYYQGVLVTKSGILAGAHLVGSGGVLSFFYPDRYSYRTADGNGTSIILYLKQFADYNLKGI